MTDQLTEFFNGSLTYAELQAGKTLLTTAAGESAVVRDVHVTAANRVPLALKVGATEVGRITGSGTLSGSEIIGPESSLSINSLAKAVVNRVGFFPNGASTTAVVLKIPTRWSGGLTSGGLATLSSTTVAAPGDRPFVALSAAGDIYYGVNSTSGTSLYKRGGGVSGTETVVAVSFGERLCYDGERYIYGVTTSSTTLKRFDTTTGTVTSVMMTGLSAAINGANTVLAACDGLLILMPLSANICIVNATSGVATDLGVANPATTAPNYIGLYKTAGGNYVGLVVVSASLIRLYRFGASLAEPVVLAAEDVTVSVNGFNSQFNGLLPMPLGSDAAVLVDQGNTNSLITVIDLPSGTVLSSAAGTTTNTGSVTPYLIPVDTARAAADFGTVAVRATGIKTT